MKDKIISIFKALVKIIVVGAILAYGFVHSCWGSYNEDSRDDQSGIVPARVR